jgi:glycerophosphoryl diester phosphodiesterase
VLASSAAGRLPLSSKPYLASPRPRVFAHRGLATSVPENTLASFLAALDLGVVYLETDVHASSDGVAVVSHDPSLLRVAALDSLVSEHTLAELERIDLGGGQGFSSLASVLAAFPEAHFNIDVKSMDAAAPTSAAILAASAADRVLLASFSERRRRAVVRAVPGVATSASGARFLVALVLAKIGATPLLRLALRGIDAVQVPERAAGFTIATARTIRRLQRAGVEVHFWTINDEASMVRLLDLGADGLVTDRCDLALRIVSERAAKL